MQIGWMFFLWVRAQNTAFRAKMTTSGLSTLSQKHLFSVKHADDDKLFAFVCQ
jgi:hypothetical protein